MFRQQRTQRYRSVFRSLAAAALLVLAATGTAQASPADVGIAAATAGCGKAPALTSGTHTIQSNGKSRSFILKVPDSYDNNHPHRLAFGFHWLGGTAQQVASGGSDGYAWAYYGMQSQAGNSTIFVAPQGINNGWPNSGGEDVTFTDDMVRLIGNSLCVDTTQLFSVGFSYGGAMSYALGCARANVFRAVAGIASPNGISGCSGGTQPIAYMGIHGISDNIASGRAQRDRFVRNNGCTPQNPPEPAPGSRTHISTAYSGCRAGYPVVWAPFDGGHQQGPVDGCAGCESGARSWVKPELWRFFTQFDSTPPQPPVQIGVNYRLVAQHSNKVAEIAGGSASAGALLRQWSSTGAGSQQFDFLDSGGGFYRVRARHSGLVLQVAGTGSGADISQQPDSNATSQQWRVVDQGGSVSLVNRQSSLAMDVWQVSTADGARISQWTVSGNANQRFQLQRVSALSTAAATAGCGKAPALRSGAQTIQSNGKTRNFILRIPDNYNNSTPYRLIFGYHWRGGTANDVDSGGSDRDLWAYYGQKRLANNSAIFVAPQGFGNGWANSGGEDVTFTDDMIRLIENDLCVDTTQRFAMGFSYGGGMSYSLACSRANVFRAVVVYSGAQLSGCSGGTQPIAYMGIHGLSDNVLNIGLGRGLRDTFVRNNGCTSQNPPEPRQGSLSHVTTTYSGCRAGYPVVWAAFDGGHGPAPIDGAPGDSGARTWTSAEAWKFISQFGSGTPPPPPPGRQVVGAQSSRCLDVPNTNGTQAQLWDCNSQASQSWTLTTDRRLTVHSGKCLDAYGQGTANGTQVVVWDCNGQANQQWNVNANGTITGAQSGLCLDAAGQGTANGTRIQLWACHGQANQQWALR